MERHLTQRLCYGLITIIAFFTSPAQAKDFQKIVNERLLSFNHSLELEMKYFSYKDFSDPVERERQIQQSIKTINSQIHLLSEDRFYSEYFKNSDSMAISTPFVNTAPEALVLVTEFLDKLSADLGAHIPTQCQAHGENYNKKRKSSLIPVCLMFPVVLLTGSKFPELFYPLGTVMLGGLYYIQMKIFGSDKEEAAYNKLMFEMSYKFDVYLKLSKAYLGLRAAEEFTQTQCSKQLLLPTNN